jgi:hypothetical protein
MSPRRGAALAVLAMIAVALGAACAHAPPPQRSAPLDPKEIAAELDAEMAEVANAIHLRRDDCPSMARDLRAVFARMRTSIAKAHRAQLDDALAKQLVIEMRAYDARSAQHRDAIDADFTAESTCAKDREVREVLMSMPTL